MNGNGTPPAALAGSVVIRRGRLTNAQITAIRLAAEIGANIRLNLPEIGNEYRNGLTAPALATRHGIADRYQVGKKVAINGVRNAIRGYYGPYHETYEGLIAEGAERASLARAHNRQTGLELHRQKSGIHALTPDQKAAAGQMGGLIRGPLSYRLRIGCHAMAPEALRDHCRRIAPLGGKVGGVAATLAKGLVPYTRASPGRISEIDFMCLMAGDPRYRGPARVNFKKMADTVNTVFVKKNRPYTRTTLKLALRKRKRRQDSTVESSVDLELDFAEKLAKDPVYQLRPRIRAVEIARLINQQYHAGKPVRSPRTICSALSRYRRTNARGGLLRNN